MPASFEVFRVEAVNILAVPEMLDEAVKLFEGIGLIPEQFMKLEVCFQEHWRSESVLGT